MGMTEKGFRQCINRGSTKTINDTHYTHVLFSSAALPAQCVPLKVSYRGFQSIKCKRLTKVIKQTTLAVV